jgi:hypothetical protein
MATTDDYTTRATELLAGAKLVPHPEDDPPGFEVDLIEELNMSIGVAAASEDEARAKVLTYVADALRARDPNYVPAPPLPSAADTVLVALSSLDPQTASTTDVIAAVTSALVDAGASVAGA